MSRLYLVDKGIPNDPSGQSNGTVNQRNVLGPGIKISLFKSNIRVAFFRADKTVLPSERRMPLLSDSEPSLVR